MQRHVHVCVCTHSSLDTFLAAPDQLESDQLRRLHRLVFRPAPLLHRLARKLASAYELAHCSTPAPRSAQKKMKVAPSQKPSISMQNKMNFFSFDFQPPISRRVPLGAHNGAGRVTEVCSTLVLTPQRLLHRVHQ